MNKHNRDLSARIAEYDSYAHFWEMIYRDKADDFPFYHWFAKQKGSPILDIGCGTARIGLLLAQQGYEVYNLDISKGMLELAKKKAEHIDPTLKKRLHLVHKDMLHFKFDKRFPLIISTFSTLFSVKKVDDFIEIAKSVSKHLNNDGVFAFDVTFFGKGKYKTWGHRAIEDNSARFMRMVKDPNDPNKRWLYIRIVLVDESLNRRKIIAIFDAIKDSLVLERRIFELSNIYLSPNEIEKILLSSGFRQVNFYGGFDKKPLYHKSYKGKQRQVVVAYK